MIKHSLSCVEAGSDPVIFNGSSFCHCVEQVFAAIKTDKGWDEDPLAVLECLQEIAGHELFDDCPDNGESIVIVSSATSGMMERVEITYTMDSVEGAE